MLKYQVIEAVKEATNDVELAFRIANLVKPLRFTELEDEEEFNTLIMECDLR
jgi:hypothetical protein